LGIELIVAHSPQAKGRVERNHGIYQDRCVKEMHLAEISCIEEANRFLEATYLPTINVKSSKRAAEPEDAHVPLPQASDQRDVFSKSPEWSAATTCCSSSSACARFRPVDVPRPHPGDRVIVRK
jgi:hypothetical protein